MESRTTRVALWVWVGLVLLFLYIPIVVICLYAFDESNVQSWPIGGLTTKWFGPAIHNGDMQQALVLSLKAAALATAIARRDDWPSAAERNLRVVRERADRATNLAVLEERYEHLVRESPRPGRAPGTTPRSAPAAAEARRARGTA